MKKGTIILISIIVIALIVGVYFLIRAQNNNNLINSVQGQIVLFYKNGCPACAAVEKFIQDNNVESKVLFEKKEVSNDAQNEKLLVLLAEKKCNLGGEISLPMIWDGLNSKCIVGEQDSINFLQEKITSDPLAGIQNQLIFFYGDGCPHCANVETFFQENNVTSKIQFEQKEVFNNKQNSYSMTLIATKKCNISSDNLGVPFLWDGPESRCVLGDQDIINFFKQKIGI
jgi:glutaredoxin